MSNFDKKIIDKYWLEVSDLTIFEAAFWMLLGDPLNHNRFYPTKDDDLYINDIDDLRHIGEDICDGDIEWRIRTDEKGEVIASAIRAGTIKTTEVECFDKKRFDFKRTRINKSDWLDWCRNHGYSELADRFTCPSNASPQETAEEMEAVAGTSLSSVDIEEQATANVDHNETLAALFDPLPVEALAKIFMTDVTQWEKWAERADRNGLKSARQGRKIFNPYKAGMWFVRNGAEGWDDARLYRTLANNLPARSRDNKHLLTGDLD